MDLHHFHQNYNRKLLNISEKIFWIMRSITCGSEVSKHRRSSDSTKARKRALKKFKCLKFSIFFYFLDFDWRPLLLSFIIKRNALSYFPLPCYTLSWWYANRQKKTTEKLKHFLSRKKRQGKWTSCNFSLSQKKLRQGKSRQADKITRQDKHSADIS